MVAEYDDVAEASKFSEDRHSWDLCTSSFDWLWVL